MTDREIVLKSIADMTHCEDPEAWAKENCWAYNIAMLAVAHTRLECRLEQQREQLKKIKLSLSGDIDDEPMQIPVDKVEQRARQLYSQVPADQVDSNTLLKCRELAVKEHYVQEKIKPYKFPYTRINVDIE